MCSSDLRLHTGGHTPQVFDVPVARGHPGNPIGWSDMQEKFLGLVPSTTLPPSAQATALFERLRTMGETQSHHEPVLVHARKLLAHAVA